MGFFRRFFAGKTSTAIRVAVAKTPLGGILRTRHVRWDVENEIDHLAEGQVQVWRADGIKAASGSYSTAAAATPLADGVRDALTVARERVDETKVALSEASDRLRGFSPLTKAEDRRYWITLGLLAASDIFGVASGLVIVGDLPLMAVFQAVGSGLAVATSGLVGAQLRKRQMAHLFEAERPPASDDDPPFMVLGFDPDDLVLRLALAVTVAITVAILALRSIQGPGIAIGYALMALVVSVGSLINAYVHARPAAEMLQGLEQAHALAMSNYLALSGHEAVAREAATLSEAGSIVAEHAVRGEAARQNVLAQLWSIFRRHPAVYGHGVEDTTKPMLVPMHVDHAVGRSTASRNGSRPHQPDLSSSTFMGRG